MSTEKPKRESFIVPEINRADGGEIVIVIREAFAHSVSQALLDWTQPWNGQPNPAVASLGMQIRDGGRILRGEPVSISPFIERNVANGTTVICDEPAD